jgi:hypothetical protein
VLTHEEEFDTWLRAPADEAFALAREYPAEQMRIVQERVQEARFIRGRLAGGRRRLDACLAKPAGKSRSLSRLRVVLQPQQC